MKKFLFISNRNSGKTQLAFYEFLKEQEQSLLLLSCQKDMNYFINNQAIKEENLNNVVLYYDFIENKHKNNFKRIIIDDYLSLNYDSRKKIHEIINEKKFQEVFCFSTPNKIYDKKLFNFIKEVKINNNSNELEEWVGSNEILVEIHDIYNKAKMNGKNEIMDLFYNYITDSDIIIIHNQMFFNERIFKLNNVSYFPDVDRELTELKGEYLRND